MDPKIAEYLYNATSLATILTWQTLLLLAICYVYGSVPYAVVFTWLFKRERITEKGSGNIGVANTFGVGGLRAGFLTVAGEASKVILALALSRYYYDGDLTVTLLLIAVSAVGTSFSVFLGGRGAQGGTILLWTLIVLSPSTFGVFIAGFVVVFLIVRSRYFASIVGHALLPLEIFVLDGRIPFVIFGVIAAVFYAVRYKPGRSDYSYYRHSMRLLRLVERTFGKKKYLLKLDDAKDASLVGAKASRLQYLRNAGLRVPSAYVCTFAAYDDYTRGNQEIVLTLRRELSALLQEGKKYSVRSSANLEDAQDHSFAGQFESYLSVGSIDEIIDAVVRVWEAARGERVRTYLDRIGGSQDDLRMAVIIQEMVDALYSGVVFTKNPLNGLDEVIVEAVSGLGVSLVQGGVAPNRWVCKWGSWTEVPETSEIDQELIGQVVSHAKHMDRKYGRPVDLEWAYDGEEIYWLQLRAVTALKGVSIYSNRISREFMPGMIKPLVWSVNTSVVNAAWKRLFVDLVGNEARLLDIHSLAKQFYYRSYFNMGIVGDMFELLGLPRESLELLLGIEAPIHGGPKLRPSLKTAKLTPRIVIFAFRMLLFSHEIESFMNEHAHKHERCEHSSKADLDEQKILRCIDQLRQASTEASYYVIISQLLMGSYDRVLERFLKSEGIDIREVSFKGTRKALRDIDPSHHLSMLHDELQKLPEEVRRLCREVAFAELSEVHELDDFRRHVEGFLAKFGHLSDSGNDFSTVPWKEKPELVLAMIADHRSPYVSREEGLRVSDLARVFVKGACLRYLYDSAMKYRLYRERVNFAYVRSYSLFRSYFMRLGGILRSKGQLAEEEDIFYLTLDEIREIVGGGAAAEAHRETLGRRKREFDESKEVDLPTVIFGDVPPLPGTRSQATRKLKGLGASRGFCDGRARVVRGIQDFAKVLDGDIVVIPHSDVSWSPIFARARGIVSESGGMLSHCAIVAREYNIPAVVSVSNATKLHDNTHITVNGYEGEVLVTE